MKSQTAKRSESVKRRVSKSEQRERRTTLLFLIPSLVGVLTFFVLPFIIVIYESFIEDPISKKFVFFDNYINLIKNFAFNDAVNNTLLFSLIAVPLAVVLSLLLAIALESNLPMRSQFRTIFLSPMMVPTASIVLIWQVMFHYNGAFNSILSTFGIDPVDWLKSDYSIIVIVILFLWKNLGYNMILFMAALGNIPKDILEVSMLEGAGPVKQFFKIKLPFLSSSILFVTILSLINSFKVFREVYLLAGSHPYGKLYTLQHFMNNTFESIDYQKLSAAAILMGIAMIIIIGVLFLIDDKVGRNIEE